MKTYNQGSLLFPKGIIQFKSAANRIVTLAPGQSVWVVNTKLDQQSKDVVKLARSGRGAGYAWSFSLNDAEMYFTQAKSEAVYFCGR